MKNLTIIITIAILLLVGIYCENTNNPIDETPLVSHEPTVQPTIQPTIEPTVSPTIQPTPKTEYRIHSNTSSVMDDVSSYYWDGEEIHDYCYHGRVELEDYTNYCETEYNLINIYFNFDNDTDKWCIIENQSIENHKQNTIELYSDTCMVCYNGTFGNCE